MGGMPDAADRNRNQLQPAKACGYGPKRARSMVPNLSSLDIWGPLLSANRIVA
jgi:hypothetical protein